MNNINDFACLVEINKIFFQCEFDHKSIDILETVTGMGFYKIYEDFVFKNSLSARNMINLVATSVYKHHKSLGMQKVKCALIANPQIELDNLATLKTHFKNLLPDLQKFNKDMKYINPKASINPVATEFYDFESAYSAAKKILNWSEDEFWLSTPKKFCFALVALAKYDKEKEKLTQKIQQQNAVNVLNGIKNLL